MLNRKRYLVVAAVLILALGFFAVKVSFYRGKLEEFKETRPYFGAYFTVYCRYDPKLTNIREVAEECWRKLDVIQLNMNSESSQGYLGLINRSVQDTGVQVSDDLYHILRDAIWYSRKTGGAFDITVRPLVQLWKQAAAKNTLPAPAEIAAALERTGSKYVRLERNNTVVLTRPGIKLDLNAIAPAFAVDLVSRILIKHGIQNFMVDGSGEIYCKGDQSGERGWRVGVHDPSGKNGKEVLGVLRLKDSAVSTSGNYERFYLIGGQKFSHIIDPRTGQPANGVVSATVIAPTAEEANAYSTSLCVLGSQEGLARVSALKGVEAMILEIHDGKNISFETREYKKFLTVK